MKSSEIEDAVDDQPIEGCDNDTAVEHSIPRSRVDSRNTAILEQMTDAVISFDGDGTIESVNPAFERMFGVEAKSIVGKAFAEAMMARDGFADFNDVVIDAVFHKQGVLARDILLDIGGKERHLSVRANFITMSENGANEGAVVVVTDQTERVLILEGQSTYAKALITMIFTMSIGIILNAMILRWFDVNSLFGSGSDLWRIITWVGIITMTLPPVIYLFISKLPVAEFGVTLNNWRQSLFESAIVIAVGGAILVCLSIYLRSVDPERAANPFFEWYHITGIGGISYVAHSCLQEFVARGALQGVLMRVMPQHREIVIILLAAVIFAAFHALVGIWFVFLTFVASVLFGILYNRHRTLIGVCLVHSVLGEMVFILDLN